MNMIKVEQVKDSTGHYDYSATLANTLKAIFGEELPDGYRARYHGVEIAGISDGGYGLRGYQLKGIKMKVEMVYGRDALRRVLVNEDNEIDADAIKAKFEELKILAEQQATLRADSASYQSTLEACLQRVRTATGAPDRYDYYREHLQGPLVAVSTNKPDSVKMEATVNGTQLTAIEAIMGEQLPELRLVVPEDKAVEVYNILNGIRGG